MLSNNSSITDERSSLKVLIEDFIRNRLQDKLDKEKSQDEEKLAKIKRAHQIEDWITDAARRASQIQLVTHAIKYVNPDAKGSNFYLLPLKQQQEEHGIVSTHTLIDRKDDVAGSASSLDVFKFLQLIHQNETLLSRMLRNDPILYAALPGSDEQKTEWFTAFSNITQEKNKPASHTLAKQIFFPIEENQYHVLAPLFQTSLVHAVYEQVQTRFDETTKEARKARKENKPYPHGYCEYINLAVQTFGGSKPQNISQLNSNRGGKCFLLPSLPPNWKSESIKPPFKVKSIFPNFGFRVRKLTKILREFLEKNIEQNNMEIRQTRAELVAEICDELLVYADEIQQLPAGWSTDANCQLVPVEAFWLDPGRAQFDSEWATDRELTDWKNQISQEFALWFNQVLQTEKLRVGDDEYAQWTRLLNRELAMLKETI